MKRTLRYMVAFAVLISWAVGSAQRLYAEVEQTELQVDGLSCPFCSLGLEKKLKRVEGVDAVAIHMKQGLTDIQSTPGAPLNLMEIRQAVKEAGFTLSDIRLTVRGVVRYEDNAWILESSGDGAQFLLFDAEHAQEERSQSATPVALGDEHVQQLNEAAKTGAHVVVEGRVHEHAGMPSGLLVERLELQGS